MIQTKACFLMKKEYLCHKNAIHIINIEPNRNNGHDKSKRNYPQDGVHA